MKFIPSIRVLASSLIALAILAQRPAADPDVITEASIRGHMGFLAGDALNGRGSGTRDEWIAATYIASQLRQWGIEPLGDAGDYVQTVETPAQHGPGVPTRSYVERPRTTGGEGSQSIA